MGRKVESMVAGREEGRRAKKDAANAVTRLPQIHQLPPDSFILAEMDCCSFRATRMAEICSTSLAKYDS